MKAINCPSCGSQLKLTLGAVIEANAYIGERGTFTFSEDEMKQIDLSAECWALNCTECEDFTMWQKRVDPETREETNFTGSELPEEVVNAYHSTIVVYPTIKPEAVAVPTREDLDMIPEEYGEVSDLFKKGWKNARAAHKSGPEGVERLTTIMVNRHRHELCDDEDKGVQAYIDCHPVEGLDSPK